VDLIELVHELLGLAGLLHPDDATGGLSFRLFIKFEKETGAFALTVGKTVQDDEARVVRQAAELVQEIFGGTIKTHINDRFLLQLGGLQKIEAEDGRQAAGIVMPNHVVSDEKPSQKQVQSTYP
jgi:hypothetical protein